MIEEDPLDSRASLLSGSLSAQVVSYARGVDWRYSRHSAPQYFRVEDSETAVIAEILRPAARSKASSPRPLWAMIVPRTPKGWRCLPEIDGTIYCHSHIVEHGDDNAGDSHLTMARVGSGLRARIDTASDNI